MTKRLIEAWLPIAELGEESMRERRSMTALPPIYYLHVWWARRPLVASRAAVLASLLPADADRTTFMHMLGIHGDPVASRKRIDAAKRKGERFEGEAYTYKRAFTYRPSEQEAFWLLEQTQKLGIGQPTVLDPTAGGGAIPFEALRLGCNTLANDINPVAVLVQKATYEWPAKYGQAVLEEFKRLADQFVKRREERLAGYYPAEPEPNCISTNYLWARTIHCPYCAGKVPLSPNWKLAPDGTGVRLVPQCGTGPGDPSRHCTFQIVATPKEHSEGTVKGGDATCPFPCCNRVIDGDQVKAQAQAGGMGEQLFAVVFKRRLPAEYTKTGKAKKDKWERGYRAPRPEDDNTAAIEAALAEKLPEWEALDLVPNEEIPFGFETNIRWPLHLYGIKKWADFFSLRQLLCHATSVEIFRDLVNEELGKPEMLAESSRSALAYLTISLDKLLNYNSRMSVWMPTREVVANTFNRHDFAFCWSHAEMAPLIVGLGYDWAFGQVAKCIGELIELVASPTEAQYATSGPLFAAAATTNAPAATDAPVVISCGSGASLAHLENSSVDAVVMDPPYYDNVMYAELSDFFYVWLKRTAGLLYPELFMAPLTDKHNEAVANPARHEGKKGAKALAGLDYQRKMAEIFAECRRVLKDDGVMTLMFTHKATGAWDALTKGLIDAGFAITASWPINSEAEGSLHIKEKSAANSTIFLVCRPRAAQKPEDGVQYWEDLEPRVKAAVRQRIEVFQASGIRGVDLYLSCFGPALEEFSRHWPIKRGQPKPIEQQSKKGKRSQPEQQELTAQEKADLPYQVTPEDALDAARREVKAWRMEKLTSGSRRAQLDPLTEWFVLAWDAFQAPQFPYDEALRLARVVGLDLDKDVVGVLAEKKASDLILWDSSTRATKGKLGAPDGSKSWIDAIHHIAHRARSIDLNAAKQLLDDNGLANSPIFLTALEAVLEVLPLSARYTGFDPVKAAAPAASDFEALENLRRLALAEQVPAPKQLELVLAELAEAS
jgi:adenine-specific DNA methylase